MALMVVEVDGAALIRNVQKIRADGPELREPAL